MLGVLIEKQKTTPEYYPMTIAAVVTACNQKSARDPVVNYDADMVEETLEGLRRKGATVLVEGQGRTVKWKHAATMRSSTSRTSPTTWPCWRS